MLFSTFLCFWTIKFKKRIKNYRELYFVALYISHPVDDEHDAGVPGRLSKSVRNPTKELEIKKKILKINEMNKIICFK